MGPVESFWEDGSGNIISKNFQVTTKNGDILDKLIPTTQLKKYNISQNPVSAKDINGKYWIAQNNNKELYLLSFDPKTKKLVNLKTSE